MSDEFGGRLTLRPQEAALKLGIGRTALYALMATGEIRSIKNGAARLIPVSELQRWLKSKQTEHGWAVADGDAAA